ncbi:ANL family adenylate-forming protein [Flavobacterium yafengii]|uniref:ANL family adenylate-forming protein n=1 Tax=Flavobacterium yafengii TaxID=3041253 RepID=UPI0024A87A98|nr:fatty acid--CoA ligase family protein [Flavobacterium yafengii]MDI6046664.1 fatty acid--CoA ligase family protein [Flavobacterium yafengii]
MSNSQKFVQKLSAFENKVAIINSGNKTTYINLVEEIVFFNNKITELNIKSGEVVFLLGDYSVESISLFFSLALNNNIIVPITSENEEELKERLDVTKPNWIFDLRKKIEIHLVENENAERHDILNALINIKACGLILFSSGSTGKPKAMVHNLDNLLMNYIDKRGKEMNFLVFLMFDHIGGLNTLFNCLSMGVTITIPENRNPNDIAALIEKWKINILPATPTFLNLMCISDIFEKFDLSSVKMITYGTEAMPEGLLLKLKSKLPRVKFLQTFGTSETGIVKTTSMSSSSTFLKFDDPNQEYKIVNNELWLRSKTQVLGYINHSNENFTEDGWFMTGDLVEKSTDRYIKIIGRTKELINVGGEKVLPGEVESIILEIDSVLDCIVRSEKNSITGQMVCADIVIKEGFIFKEEKLKIKKHCKHKLDSYKVPIRINQIDSVSFTNRFKKNRQL